MSYLLESNIYAKRKGKKAIPWTASEKHKLAVKKKKYYDPKNSVSFCVPQNTHTKY